MLQKMKYSESAYEKRLAELFRKFPSVQKEGFKAGAYKEGLDGMRRLDGVLGHPHTEFRTVHVAGTNGKGSVSSMLAAALGATGLKVGLYTSPHLLDFRERIKIVENGGSRMIPREAVWDFLERYDNDLEGLSFFEITTGMCFHWFAQSGVDAAVIEVGLGGRLDSTNIINPELCVITSIGLDHCALLGQTRTAIAAEKAGIFKAEAKALIWGRDEQTSGVFEETAARVGAQLHFAGGELPDEEAGELDLKGEYQSLNLRTVKAALDLLGIDPEQPQARNAILNAAAVTGLRGRWEILDREPLTIADIGHNPAALKLNFAQLERLGKPMTIVYGIMADKDLDSIIPLMPGDARYVFCAPATARALNADELLRRVSGARPGLQAEAAPSVASAIERACETADPDSVIYIGGSAFVVAEALPLWPR